MEEKKLRVITRWECLRGSCLHLFRPLLLMLVAFVVLFVIGKSFAPVRHVLEIVACLAGIFLRR